MKAVFAFLGLIVLLNAPEVSAQESRPERPFRGLFGGGVADSPQTLSLGGSLSGGFDDNIFADADAGQVDPRLRKGGSVAQGGGNISYSLGLGRVAVNASASSSLRYYPDVSDDMIRTSNASAGASVRLLNRPAVVLSQSVSYQPVSFAALFPVLFLTPAGTEIIPQIEFLVVPLREHYLAYSGGLSMSERLSTRTTFSANYGYRVSEGLVFDSRFLTQSLGAALQTELTGGLSVRAGYAYSEGRYGGAGDDAVRGHSADLGINYGRALSFSRRTTLSFGTGSTGTASGGKTQFRVSGRARLTHEIGRTWSASLGYNRGLQFVETLRQPVFSDSLTATLSGLFSRRLSFRADARTALGEVGTTGDNTFGSYRASASLTIAASRYVNMGVEYAYYKNDFGSDVLLPSGFLQNVDRQSVSVNMNVWAPLFSQRSR